MPLSRSGTGPVFTATIPGKAAWRDSVRPGQAESTTISLPAFSVFGCDLDGREGGRAARDAAEHPLLASQPAGCLERILVADRDHVVDDRDVEHVGDESRTDALNLVRAGPERLLSPQLADHRRVDRLDRDDLNRRLAALQHLAAAR